MTTKERNSFIFYRSFYEAIKLLPAEKQLKIYQKIAEFSFENEKKAKKIELDNIQKSIFILIKPQLEANRKRFINGCKKKKSKKEANDKQTISKVEANLNVNDNVNVNDNQNKKRKEIKEKNHPLLISIWNETCLNLPKATLNSRSRNLKLDKLIGDKRVKDDEGKPLFECLEDWGEYCKQIHQSPFLNGDNKRGWIATIDFCLKTENINKIIEGNYDRRENGC
jgi:hypothetical protein